MKVLLVLEAALGGTGRHVMDLATGLLNRGFKVHLVHSTARADEGFSTGLAALMRTEMGLQCHAIAVRRELDLSDIACYFALLRYVVHNGPFDIIHAHSTKAGFLVRLLLRRYGARVIYTPNGLMTANPELTGIRRQAVCLLERTLSRFCDAVIAVSRQELQGAIQIGIPQDKLIVVSNALSPASLPDPGRRSDMRALLNLQDGTLCIGFVGRLANQKEPLRVVEAFALLRNRTPQRLILAIIGWGPLESTLRQRVTELRIGNDVVFLGQVPAISYMPAFDMLAHTSSYEGFPYTFLEALAAGLPIVTTNVGGVDELLTPGVTGYVCDPWNSETFAAYLQRLVEEPELRTAMGAAGRERAAQFTASSMVEATARVYSRVCERLEPIVAVQDANRARSPQPAMRRPISVGSRSYYQRNPPFVRAAQNGSMESLRRRKLGPH
jgi:glycosyltransferase involved in cell wall biosynthesis